MKKVAIIQNRLQKGGRMQVTLEIISVLNEMGIVPDLVTLKSNISKEEIIRNYGKNLDFTIRTIFFDVKLPFEWHILFFNFITRFYLSSYDLVINSNNTSFLLSNKLNLLSYIHFPRKTRNVSPKKDIHFPDGKNKSWFDFKNDPFKLAHFFYVLEKGTKPKELIMANSSYTASNIKETLHLDFTPEVVYPPVPSFHVESVKKKNLVVSLGRFSPDKRQLEQIKMAEKIPQMEFRLIGFVNNAAYFEKCKEYIKKNSVQNVVLMGNAAFSDVEKTLLEAEVFLHFLINEPFGITSVQAINKGCIPIVHDSGGQREVVTLDELRFSTFEQVEEKLRMLSTLDEPAKKKIILLLQENAKLFEVSPFREKMRTSIRKKLNL